MEIQGCPMALTARRGLQETPRNPKLSNPSLESLRRLWGAWGVEAKWQRVFILSMLILLNVSVPSLRLQPPPTPQCPGSSLLRSCIHRIAK